MKKSKKQSRITIIIVLAVIVVIAIVALSITARKGTQNSTYQRYVVQEGELEKTVSGKGVLQYRDTLSISIPAGVKIDKVFIKQGITVHKGDILASLDIHELTTLKSKYAANSKELEQRIISMDAKKSEKATYSRVSGRVKAISQNDGDTDLVVIAVDGKMRVTMISNNHYPVGTHVQARLNGSIAADGTIMARTSEGYIIEISDDTLPVGKNADIYLDDDQIGEGILQVNAPVIISGDYYNVARVHIRVEDKVSVGTKLISWKKARITATYSDIMEEYHKSQTRLGEIEELISSPVIVAEQTGIISEVKISDGDMVEQTSDYIPIFTQIIGGANLFEADVSENDIALLYVGQNAQVKLNAFTEPFSAEVTSINSIGKVSSGSTTFAIRLALIEDERFLVGMNGKALFTIGGTGKSILLPLALVMEDAEGEYVYISPSGDFTGKDRTRRSIVTGLANDDYVQIISGLQKGDIVLFENSGLLSTAADRESNGNGE